MADALANRLALLQLAAELRQATTRAEHVLDGGTAADMLAAVVDLSHRAVSLALLSEAVSRDSEGYAQRAEAAEARQHRTLRGALRGVALELVQRAGDGLRRRRSEPE